MRQSRGSGCWRVVRSIALFGLVGLVLSGVGSPVSAQTGQIEAVFGTVASAPKAELGPSPFLTAPLYPPPFWGGYYGPWGGYGAYYGGYGMGGFPGYGYGAIVPQYPGIAGMFGPSAFVNPSMPGMPWNGLPAGMTYMPVRRYGPGNVATTEALAVEPPLRGLDDRMIKRALRVDRLMARRGAEVDPTMVHEVDRTPVRRTLARLAPRIELKSLEKKPKVALLPR